MWRYREVLPLPGDFEPISLGEGGTPLLPAAKFGDGIELWIKDESLNPTQSFKARGMSVCSSGGARRTRIHAEGHTTREHH